MFEMKKLLIVFLMLSVLNVACQSDNQSLLPVGEGQKSIIIDDENVRRFHVATRPHNRKVIFHEPSGYWYSFYGHGDRDPDGKYRISWRSSKDGINWSERHTAFEGNSHSSSTDVLLTDNKITMLIFRPNYHREQAGVAEFVNGKRWYDRPKEDFPLPYEIGQFDIKDGILTLGPIYAAIPGTAYNGRPHYGSLTQDANGYFWIGARAMRLQQTDKTGSPYQAWVARSSRANDISEWEPHTVLFRSSRKGTVAVQVIALDKGDVYAVIFSQADVKIFGTLYDSELRRWEEPYVIAEGNKRSKRPVATFDPGTGRLHLVYIDNSGALRHKIQSAPYSQRDWLPAAGKRIRGNLVDSKVTTREKADNNISLSIDTSMKPASLAVAYHKDTPHYRLRFFDGSKWGSESYKLGIQQSDRYARELSMNRNFSDKLGMVYYVTSDDADSKTRGELHFLEVPGSFLIDNLGE